MTRKVDPKRKRDQYTILVNGPEVVDLDLGADGAAALTPSVAVAATFAAVDGSSGRAVVGGGFGSGYCGL